MRLLRGFAFVLLYLALFFGGIYAVEDWRGARAWDAAVREAKEHGGTTDFAAIIPPPIPDDQNLAMAPFFVKALNYQIDPDTKQLTIGQPVNNALLDQMPYGPVNPRTHGSTSSWQRGRPADLGVWQNYFRDDPEFPRAPEPQSPAAGVLMALSRYSVPLSELAAAAAARPRSRFPINWSAPNPVLISLRHTDLLRRLAAALSVRASAEVASGKQAIAAADIALGFRLSEALNDDPFLIDDATSNLIVGMMTQPVWDGLASRAWDADQLQALQKLLSRQDALASYASAVRTEEGSVARQMDYLERHGNDMDILRAVYFLAPAHVTFQQRLLCKFAEIGPRGWYDQNKALIVRFEQKHVLGSVNLAAHRVFPSKIAAGIAEASATRLSAYTFFYRADNWIFENTMAHAARAQVTCDQAAIACALERYSLDHHSYPENLAELTPAYMPRPPTDVIGGAPMHYQRTPDSRYRLYGIGWNARDDGGKVGWQGYTTKRLDDKTGDWVWQYQPINPPEFRQN